jgi:hypothetical protein
MHAQISLLWTVFWVLAISLNACSTYNPGHGQSGGPCNLDSDCDDENPCSDNRCENMRCQTSPLIGSVCIQPSECMVGLCSKNGECENVPSPGDVCDDNDPCTASDRCNSEAVCEGNVNEALGAPCDDGDPCTADTTCHEAGDCLGGVPASDEPSCATKDPCTSGNICLEDGSCSSGTPITLPVTTCEICSCNSLWGVECTYPRTVECPCNLWGNITFVESFPDIKVRFVESFPDLEIEIIEGTPTEPGQWREVDSFADFTVQVVDSFPDFDIRLTDSPDTPCN